MDDCIFHIEDLDRDVVFTVVGAQRFVLLVRVPLGHGLSQYGAFPVEVKDGILAAKDTAEICIVHGAVVSHNMRIGDRYAAVEVL